MGSKIKVTAMAEAQIDDSKSTVIDSFCLPHISSGFVFSSVFYVILYTAVKDYYHVYTE